MFGGDDEEGDFLSPTGGAKLASLFGLDQEGSQGNDSFQYTAPKQPRKSPNSATAGQKPAPPPGAPAVLFATAVQAFRYINGQYAKQGKLGAAVLGNHATKEYKLLLYLSQQKQVTAAKIHVGFVFTVQPNNYFTFYDEQRQNWSLMFESEKAASDFCKEVCLAKANSAVSLDAVVVQDLSLGEGQAVENGDSLEVVYTGWLLQNHAIGQMFDSNQNKDKLLRLKIGAGKVIKGWEEGMIGMKKAGRRLIVIPPNQAYGSKGVPNRVPANSTLIFEAELRRVTTTEQFSASISLSLTRVEPPLRAKSNSLSEQLANPDATKAKLISRMAKMGQPMLPFLTGGASQPESSDSELEVGLQNFKREPYSYTQTSVAPSQLQPVGQVYPSQTIPYMGSSDVTSFLMTEARQHNTEIRLSVGKVADKVDQLASKIDDLQRQGNLSTAVPSMSMETSMIMHNIQRIIQENECLKKEVFEKSSRIEEQNRKIGELINQNQSYMEQSNLLLEQRNDSLKSSSEQIQARLLQAEQDKVRLTEDLTTATAQLSQLQLEATAHQQKAMELQGKLGSSLQDSERHCQRIAALETQMEGLSEMAQAQYRSEKQRRKEMELRVNNMEEELQDLKTDKESLERALLERRKKWQAERQHRDEEVEELRKSSQQELDNLRAQLRKARTSTDNAASEQVASNQRALLGDLYIYVGVLMAYIMHVFQLSQLQAELEEEWKGKCEQMLASAKEQHSRALAELIEQRDALQDNHTQLLEKARCVYLQVKRVMNGVFHSLRGEFDLGESYSGQAVLGVIVTTIKVREFYTEMPKHILMAVILSYFIKHMFSSSIIYFQNVTLQLLSGTDRSPPRPVEKEEEAEEEEEEESEDVTQRQENVHVNGDRGVKEEEKEEVEHEAESESHQVSETQMDREVAAEEETETVTESNAQSPPEATDLNPDSHAEPKLQETAESEVQQEQAGRQQNEKDTNKSADPGDEPDQSSPPGDGQETVSERHAAVSSEEDKESVDDGEHVEEMHAASLKAFGPPANPPPPPSAIYLVISLVCVQSLKGRPPPAPLFGDDEEDNDLDWLN
uniref:peptidylprolyl isomerase n=1 Tax=Sander lucioperca TaxID=283035 RepID=A0A8D0CRZ0_SANLU